MARASPMITATNAGELSPTLDGRIDLAKYPAGCKRLENFLSLVQGPAVRRAGTRFVAEVKDSAANHPWLIKFEYSATQCFYLEFGDLYVRFFTDHGVLESSPGVPYEIVSPYALADLTNDDGTCALQIEQSGDVLYIASMKRTYAPQKLTRVTNTNWVFSTYEPNQGPLLEQNTTSTVISASAASGSVTLTASAPVFSATDIGRLVRLDVRDFTTKPWQTATGYVAADVVRSDGKAYAAANNASSGPSPPVHEKGSAYDGNTGVQWGYLNPGYGMLRITAFTDSTHVTATVIIDETNGIGTLPTEVVGSGTPLWQLGAWSATTEYPGAVTFFLSRLFWAGQQRIWGSVPDDFENMAEDFFGEVRADNAIKRILAAKDVNGILWIAGADKLVIGTGGGEFVAGPLTTSEPLGPANFEIVPQSRHRVRGISPIAVGTSNVYVQRAGRKVLSLDYAVETDRFASTDRAVLAARITRPGVIGLAYQGEPHSIVWAWLSSGALRSFTFEQEQDVQGWARHPLGGGGAVESVACGPTPDGGRDEVWMIVRRTINGATKRYVEFMEQPWEGADDDGTPGDDQEDAFYVDCGLSRDGAPTTAISGLNHLEGATVQILADGAVHPDQIVSGGAITLLRAASVVHVGLGYTSRLVPMRIEAGSQTGAAQGKIQRIDTIVLRLLDSLGGKIGQYGEELDSLSRRYPSTPMGQASPFFSGDLEPVQYPGDYERGQLVEIVQDQPLPMTVVAIMPQMKTNDP